MKGRQHRSATIGFIAPPAELDRFQRVIENLRRTQLRLNVLEHYLRENRLSWADVAAELAEEVAADAATLEQLNSPAD